MKHICIYFIALLTFLIPTVAFSQGGNKLTEKGFGVIALNKKLSALKTYLVPKPQDSLKVSDHESSSAWLVDVKKAQMTTYFGLKVNRVEVYFNFEYDQEGEPTKTEIVSEFIVYLEPPANREAEIEFQSKLIQYYGSAIAAKTEAGQAMNFIWFGDTTLLQVNFGYGEGEIKNGNYTATFNGS